LAVVAAWWPQGARGLLVGAREFGTGGLAQGALPHGWDLGLRRRAQEYVRRVGLPYCELLPLGLPGARRCWSPVAFPQAQAGAGLTLALDWAATAAAPWFLLTPAPPGPLAGARYATRFRLEEMCKDCKNTGRGCGLELTGGRHAERLARRRLALALV
jgi:hypothetical protein